MAIQSESGILMPIPFLKGLAGGLIMISSLGFVNDFSRFDLQEKRLYARWWFQICFIFTPIWGNDPF